MDNNNTSPGPNTNGQNDNLSPHTEVEQSLQHQEQPTLPMTRTEPSPNQVKPEQDIPPAPFHKKEKRKRSPLRIALSIFGIFLLLSCATLSIGYYYYQNNIQKPLSQFIRPVSRGNDEPAINATPSYNIIEGRSWNILLLGSDNDGKYIYPNILTQVMMVVHIDTVNKTVNMVSIPRDSWVAVPEIGGMHKIDQAFLLATNQNNKFEDGVRLARLTIEKDYGISIDRYAWVGLSGFAKVINTLGGVNVDVTHPVVDDTYPDDTGAGSDPNNPNAYKRLYLAPGPQHLTGDQALEYVRSRHADLVGDIGRTKRQQQVLEALKQKLNVSSVITNLPQLLKDLTGEVYTDLSEPEMLAFANFGRTLTSNAIQRLTLGPGQNEQNFGAFANVYDPSLGSNQDVVIPNCDTIQPVINRIFDLGNNQSCNVTGS